MSWTQVGKVKDAHSLKGELYIFVFSGDVFWWKKLKRAQIGAEVFEVEKTRPHKDGLIIKFKSLQNRTQAEALRGRIFSIPSDFVVSELGETIFLNEILNFKLIDEKLGSIGKITNFSNNGAQDLLVIENLSGNFEVPFVEAFVKDIDYKKKEVFTSLPDGLVEINQRKEHRAKSDEKV